MYEISFVATLTLNVAKESCLEKAIIENVCVIHCSITYSGQVWKHQVRISGRVHRTVMVQIYNGMLLGQKKNEILSFVTAWMDLEDIMLSETSQTEKDRYHVILLTCGI